MYVLLTLAWVNFGAFMHGAPARVSYSAPFRSEQACMDAAYDKMAPRRDAYAQAICYATKDTVTVEPDGVMSRVR